MQVLAPTTLTRESLGSLPAAGASPVDRDFDAVLERARRTVAGGSASESERKLADLRRVSHELEAVVIRQMFGAMRNTITQSEMFKRGRAESTFQDMLDGAMADKMAAAGGLGLGEMIYGRLAKSLQRDLAAQAQTGALK